METWDQSKFTSTLREYLLEHRSKVWPQVLNKKLHFVALAALQETPRKEEFSIFRELMTPVFAHRHDDSGRELPGARIPVGFAIAAKRASAKWTASTRYQKVKQKRAEGKNPSLLTAWYREMDAKLGKITGGRFAAAGFLKVGWLSVLQQTGPAVGLSRGSASGVRLHGNLKANVTLATSQSLKAIGENFAHARSETRGAFERIGGPALQRAFDRETASMQQYLEGELEPGIRKFNQAQH